VERKYVQLLSVEPGKFVCMCDMTHLLVSSDVTERLIAPVHDSQKKNISPNSSICVTQRIHMCDSCIHICHTTHAYVSRDSITRVTEHFGHDSFMLVS